MDPVIKKRLVRVVYATAAFTVLTILLIILFRKDESDYPRYYQSQILASNLAYGEQVSDNKIRFFTGTAVAELDINNTKKSKSLTNEFGLGKIQKVFWGKEKVYIKSSQLDKTSPLLVSTRAKNNKNFFTSNETWWMIDIKSNNIFPVYINHDPARITGDICVSENKLYAAVRKPNTLERLIVSYSFDAKFNLNPTGASSESYLLPSFVSCDDDIVFTSGNGQLVVYSNTVSENPTSVASNVVYAKQNKDLIVFAAQIPGEPSDDDDHDHSRNPLQTIYTIDTATYSNIKEIKSLDGQKFFILDDRVFIQYIGEDARYDIYSLNDGKFIETHYVSINKQAIDRTDYMMGPFTEQGSTSSSYVLVDNNGEMSTISTDENNLLRESPSPAFRLDELEMSLSVDAQAIYDRSIGEVEIIFGYDGPDIQGRIQKLSGDLAKKTDDVNQIRKVWTYAGDFYD